MGSKDYPTHAGLPVMEKLPGGLISIHVAILLFGLAGLFGKFLALDAILIVQGRTLIAFVVLLAFMRLMRMPILLRDRRQWIWLTITGAVLGVHWIGFFRSIQVSSVAIGLLSFSSYQFFTTFMEPLFFRERLRQMNVIAAIVVMAGLALIATSGTTESSGLPTDNVIQGGGWGLFSGFSFAVLTLLNRKQVERLSALNVACWQNGIAAMTVFPLSLSLEWNLTLRDVGLLLLLGFFCTAAGHVMLINGLRQVRAQLASLLHAGLEPVYAIVFALLLLNEVPGLQTLSGGLLIVGVSILMSIEHASS